MRNIIERIQTASTPTEAEKVDMNARIEEAAKLLELLNLPEVVQKIISADPFRRSKPTYYLGKYKRDDTGAEVSLLLFNDYSYLDEEDRRVYGMFLRESMDIFLDSSYNQTMQQIMGSETKRLDFLKTGWPEYKWGQIGNNLSSFRGSMNLKESYDLAIAHGSHLEAIEMAILNLIQPQEA